MYNYIQYSNKKNVLNELKDLKNYKIKDKYMIIINLVVPETI